MKKKQIIGLGTLLLVCLLGLFTTSYANSYRDFTETEIKNILYKAWMNAGYSETDVINAITTHENNGNITTVVNALNNNNNCIISFGTGSTGWNECVISCYNSQSNTHPYFYDGRIIFKNRPSGTTYNIFYNGTFSTGSIFSYSYASRTDYIYYGDTFYNSSSGTTVTHAANTYTPSTFFDDWYYQDALPFTFIPKPADEYADVYDFEDVPLYNASGEDLYIGQLFKPQTSVIEYWSVNNYYYRFGDWNFRDLPSRSFYMNYVGSDDSNDIYDVFLDKDFITENTIYSTIWADSSTEPYTLAIGNFYLKNNNTIVSNGVVDVSKTFSGDYKDKYDNNLNNQEDVNNIEQAITGTILDDSEVDNILGQFDSSGEIKEVFGYQDIGEKTEGFTIPRMYITYLMQEVLNTLAIVGDEPGNSYIDIPIDGKPDYRVYARYFHTPDGTLMIFVRNLLIFGGIYCLYKYFVEVAELLTTFNIHEAANKVDTDQFIFRM